MPPSGLWPLEGVFQAQAWHWLLTVAQVTAGGGRDVGPAWSLKLSFPNVLPGSLFSLHPLAGDHLQIIDQAPSLLFGSSSCLSD